MAFSSATISVGETTKKSHFDQLLDNTISLKSENMTINGEKTFASATAFQDKIAVEQTATFNSSLKASSIESRTSTAGVLLGIGYGGQSATVGVATMRCKILEIGEWNMDATAQKIVPHGFSDINKIRRLETFVRMDSGLTSVRNLMWGVSNTNTTTQGTISQIDNTNVYLYRLNGGLFDATTFNQVAGFNRGWITIWFVD